MSLRGAHRVLLMLGIVLLVLQYAIERIPNLIPGAPSEYFMLGGVPIPGVFGGAFILLVTTSWLNWKFRVAWEERSKSLTAPTKERPTDH